MDIKVKHWKCCKHEAEPEPSTGERYDQKSGWIGKKLDRVIEPVRRETEQSEETVPF